MFIKFLSVAFAGWLATTAVASANTTVDWTGSNNFDDGQINFTAFQADQLVDIFGSGLYEGCCRNKTTNFTLQIDLNGSWTTILTWSTTGDNTTHSLGDLVPPAINFTEGLVSGIKVTSSPDGGYNDPNFTNFKFFGYLSQQEYYDQHRSEYKNWWDFVQCGDYDRYLKNVTSFVFADVVTPPNGPPPATTPLPGALTLLASGAGVFGFARWRRKKKTPATN
jgi:hypothetical protein